MTPCCNLYADIHSIGLPMIVRTGITGSVRVVIIRAGKTGSMRVVITRTGSGVCCNSKNI